MQIDIRENIKTNFKNSSIKDIEDSIVEAISEHDEITLPGLGVFFEILWNNSNAEQKTNILNNIKKGL